MQSPLSFVDYRPFAAIGDLLRLDPLVDGGFLEAPVGSHLKAGQFAAGGVFIDR